MTNRRPRALAALAAPALLLVLALTACEPLTVPPGTPGSTTTVPATSTTAGPTTSGGSPSGTPGGATSTTAATSTTRPTTTSTGASTTTAPTTTTRATTSGTTTTRPPTTTTTTPPSTPQGPPTTVPSATTPVWAGDFPDPSVILEDGVYHAFSTEGNGAEIQRLTSTDRLRWTRPAQPEALRAVPTWADTAGTWAPEVVRVGGQLVLYYTVHSRSGSECVTLATSPAAGQQFVDRSTGPMVCQVQGGGSIDPSPFTGADGTRYLLWKSNTGGEATIFVRALTADGTAFAAAPARTLLGHPGTTWSGGNIEGPSMEYLGGTWRLFYSANVYWSDSYGVGYADCAGPLGPCTNRTLTQPWLGSHGAARGPGGQTFFTDATGQLVMAYHAWNGVIGYERGGVRALWTAPVGVVGGRPVLG